MIDKIDNNVGWNFNNSYIKLPSILMSKIDPVKVPSPELLILNKDLAMQLNLNFEDLDPKKLSLIFSGNILPIGTQSIAQAYAGHQFGFFTILGDGRAILLGEHINKKKERYDIQLKGSGRTPYSRNGDGKAALGPMLREYLISEVMYGLKIPTTRALAVTTTGENVYREEKLKGAILTRTASSHIRVGTFQYAAINKEIDVLKQLVDYTIKRHYPDIPNDKNKYINLLKQLMVKQISLIIDWMRVGFIHGVMNTDNVTLSGETIDYGPCSFMDYYNPKTVFSSIDHQGRYSFINQEIICHWNISRFAETLIPFFSNDEKKSIKIGTKIINEFSNIFKKKWLNMMRNKLGFTKSLPEDEKFINKILLWMEENNADYTNTFLYLMNYKEISDPNFNKLSFKNIHNEWKKRIEKNNTTKEQSFKIMCENNPFIIPRNHIVEKILQKACENNDLTDFNNLIKLTKNPYTKFEKFDEYLFPPSFEFIENYKTFCGT